MTGQEAAGLVKAFNDAAPLTGRKIGGMTSVPGNARLIK